MIVGTHQTELSSLHIPKSQNCILVTDYSGKVTKWSFKGEAQVLHEARTKIHCAAYPDEPGVVYVALEKDCVI